MNEENELIWQSFLGLLKNRISTVSINSWFKYCKIYNIEDSEEMRNVMILKYKKIDCDNYETVRQVINGEFGISSNLLIKLKKHQKILLNHNSTYIDKVINVGDVITVIIDFEEDNSNIVPTNMELHILYEDDGLLIVDKPSGIPVHPSILHYDNSLSNGVKYYFDTINLHKKIRPVNRLDKNTSGIVVFAKNEYIHDSLSKQMQNNIFKKEYITICEGKFDIKEGTINKPISRKANSIIERCVNPTGENAITHYKVIKEIKLDCSRNSNSNNNLVDFDWMSELLINLETGRTHQIRVHMAYIGHPVLGDSLYGHESSLINRQALHAYKIEFVHPITKEKIIIEAPLPEDMQKLILW